MNVGKMFLCINVWIEFMEIFLIMYEIDFMDILVEVFGEVIE